jgi:hypothetical protein
VDELLSELKEVWPEAVPGRLGANEVFLHHLDTPAHSYDSVIKFIDGPRLIELTARDSFDPELARFLLDQVGGPELPALGSRRIRVLSSKFPDPWPFECIVIVPPRIAKRFENESARLRRITYWVVPTFAAEFRDGEDGDAFWRQIYRRDGWNFCVVRWDRSRKTKPLRD